VVEEAFMQPCQEMEFQVKVMLEENREITQHLVTLEQAVEVVQGQLVLLVKLLVAQTAEQVVLVLNLISQEHRYTMQAVVVAQVGHNQ
jgi:putative exporter of polyketide antibiotics